MIAVELATYRVSEDLTFPTPAGGYIVACTALYERGFSVPSHQFLRSLLQFYGLELYHLTPSGILHMAAFMTLCEVYMGIEPHFDQWNYFFRARPQQGSDAEAAVLGSEDIFLRSGPAVHPNFCLLTSDPPVGWRKVWFFLRNDTDALLSMFTGSRPVPQPKWGYCVAQKDLRMLQSLCEVIQWLIRGGLMGVDLLWTFVSCRVQPLHQREITMWMYLGPSCLVRPFSVELDDTEINTRIWGGPCSWGQSEFWLWPGPFKGRGCQPLGESVRAHFHLLVSISASQRICILAQDLGYARSALRRFTLPEDVVRREANRANSERLRARRQRKRAWTAARTAVRAWVQETPSELESLGGGDEEEGEVTPPPHSPPHEDLPSPDDLFSQQAGISVGVRRPKCPRTGTGHRLAHCRSLVLRWNLLAYKG
jgi:hypothetical protein